MCQSTFANYQRNNPLFSFLKEHRSQVVSISMWSNKQHSFKHCFFRFFPTGRPSKLHRIKAKQPTECSLLVLRNTAIFELHASATKRSLIRDLYARCVCRFCVTTPTPVPSASKVSVYSNRSYHEPTVMRRFFCLEHFYDDYIFLFFNISFRITTD